MRINSCRAGLLLALLLNAGTSSGVTPSDSAANSPTDRLLETSEAALDTALSDPPLALRAETALASGANAFPDRSPFDTSVDGLADAGVGIGTGVGVNAGVGAGVGAGTHPGIRRLAMPEGKIADWVAVESHLLDDLRGGFDTSLHLTLSFGIERAVYLNGALVTTTSFNLPAMRGLGIEDAGPATGLIGNATSGAIAVGGSSGVFGTGTGLGAGSGVSPGSIALIQNGPGNSFAGMATALPMAATVIQNTLNNQSIQSLTTINASANSIELLRANAFQNVLRDGISGSIAPH